MTDVEIFEQILSQVPEYSPGHHLGRPFLSVYQLALLFAEQHPDHERVRRLPIGGTGTGESQSLAQWIARTLSTAIRDRRTTTIEGGFIAHCRLEEMRFGSGVEVSTLKTKDGHSIFRYIGAVSAQATSE